MTNRVESEARMASKGIPALRFAVDSMLSRRSINCPSASLNPRGNWRWWCSTGESLCVCVDVHTGNSGVLHATLRAIGRYSKIVAGGTMKLSQVEILLSDRSEVE